MIATIKRLFNKPKRMLIVITFVNDTEGKVKTSIKVNKAIPVDYAIAALDRLSFNMKAGLTNKAHAKGFNHKNPQTRAFIRKQTLNDVM